MSVPRTYITVKTVMGFLIHRNIEFHVVQLIGVLVKEEHILARGARIAKAIAQVPADRMAILNGIQGGPIPKVLVTPDPAAPIEDAIAILIEIEEIIAEFGITGALQVIDLLVVIEMMGLFKGGGNYHRIPARRLLEEEVDPKFMIFGLV